MAMPVETVRANVSASMRRALPRLDKLPEWGKSKGDCPIAIVGGGPSLAKTLHELRAFRHIIVCGSAHDYIIEQGIEPQYCVVLDPDPIAANYLRKPCPATLYLVASQCDEAVFSALKDVPVALFHCGGALEPEDFNFEGQLHGGCTVTLRAFVVAIMLGYTNQHYFGFDSCLAVGGKSHAYDAEDVGKPIEVRLPESDRIYQCAPYHLAQAQQWQKDVLGRYGDCFDPVIHGDGLIAHIHEWGARKAEQIGQSRPS